MEKITKLSKATRYESAIMTKKNSSKKGKWKRKKYKYDI